MKIKIHSAIQRGNPANVHKCIGTDTFRVSWIPPVSKTHRYTLKVWFCSKENFDLVDGNTSTQICFLGLQIAWI
jgi:hypothetical protein